MSVTEAAAPPPPRRGSSTKVAAAVVILLAFLAGIVVGIAGDRFWQFRHRGGPGDRGKRMTKFLAERLDKQLDLDDTQRAQVEQILERHRARIDALMSGVQPQMRAEIDATNREISAVLTPEQREKFEKLKMRMLRHRGGPPPGGAPPPERP